MPTALAQRRHQNARRSLKRDLYVRAHWQIAGAGSMSLAPNLAAISAKRLRRATYAAVPTSLTIETRLPLSCDGGTACERYPRCHYRRRISCQLSRGASLGSLPASLPAKSSIGPERAPSWTFFLGSAAQLSVAGSSTSSE